MSKEERDINTPTSGTDGVPPQASGSAPQRPTIITRGRILGAAGVLALIAGGLAITPKKQLPETHEAPPVAAEIILGNIKFYFQDPNKIPEVEKQKIFTNLKKLMKNSSANLAQMQ